MKYVQKDLKQEFQKAERRFIETLDLKTSEIQTLNASLKDLQAQLEGQKLKENSILDEMRDIKV